MKKILCLVFVLLFVSTTLFVMTGSATNSNSHILYKKDTKFSLDEYPAEIIDGELYVPSSFFIGFDNIVYEYMPRENSFYFFNTKTGKYFSFSFKIDSIIVNGEFTQRKFPLKNSTIYMPLEFCANILSLKTETYVEGKTTRIRLTDGSEKLSFIELIELFDPAGRLEQTPEKDDTPTIRPPDVKPPSHIESKKTVYLMINTDEDAALPEMLDLIRAFGERATIFFTKDTIEDTPEEILHALVGSNAIAISTSGKDNLSNELKEINEAFLLMSNSSTLIYTADEKNNGVSDAEKSGYVLWTSTLTQSDNNRKNAEKLYQEILEKDRSAIMISASKSNINFLTALLGYLSNDEGISVATINSSTPKIQNS